eukprot:gene12508-biopygen12863
MASASGAAAKVRDKTGTVEPRVFSRALRAEHRRSECLRTLKQELLSTQHHRTEHFRLVSDIIWRVAEGRYQVVLAPDSPLRELVLREAHEAPSAGHTGRDKTLDRVQRRVWWPRMDLDVAEWVKTCVTCQQTQPRQGYPTGLLQPHRVPSRLWEVVSIDFVTGKGGRVAADKRETAYELAKQFARQLQAARVNLQMVQQHMVEQFDARHE